MLGALTPMDHWKDYKLSRKCIVLILLLFLNFWLTIHNSTTIKFIFTCIRYIITKMANSGFFEIMKLTAQSLKPMNNKSHVRCNMSCIRRSSISLLSMQNVENISEDPCGTESFLFLMVVTHGALLEISMWSQPLKKKGGGGGYSIQHEKEFGIYWSFGSLWLNGFGLHWAIIYLVQPQNWEG